MILKQRERETGSTARGTQQGEWDVVRTEKTIGEAGRNYRNYVSLPAGAESRLEGEVEKPASSCCRERHTGHDTCNCTTPIILPVLPSSDSSYCRAPYRRTVGTPFSAALFIGSTKYFWHLQWRSIVYTIWHFRIFSEHNFATLNDHRSLWQVHNK